MAAGTDSGILECRLLDGQGGSRNISIDEATLANERGEVVWVHLDFESQQAGAWLRETSGLDEPIIDALLAEDSRPRYLAVREGSLIVLRGVNTNPGQDPDDMVSIRLWVEAGRIISTRRRRLLAVQELAETLDKGKGPSTSGEFVSVLVERLADRIGDFVDAIEDDLDDCESALQAQEASGLGGRISGIRRQIAGVRRYLSPQRDALDKLARFPAPWIAPNELHVLNEASDRVTRYLEDLDLARERAMVLREERDGQLAQQQNARMYVLSIVAAIFLPLTFLTGMFGMNVGGLPGVGDPDGFVSSMILMGVSTLLVVVYFRFKKWF